MFDAGRLLVCNKRYVEMYGLSPESAARPQLRELGRSGVGDRHASRQPRRVMPPSSAAVAEGRTTSYDQGGWTAARSRSPTSRWPAADGFRRTRTSPSGGAPRQRIAHLAHHDPLTDLPNRAAFNERLAAHARAGRHGQ